VHPQFHGQRWHTVAYSGFNVKGTAFKFKFKNAKGGQLQLGEIIFYQTLAPQTPASYGTNLVDNHSDLVRINLHDHGARVLATHIVPRGGGTGKEVPANLIDAGQEAWNKWYQASSNQSRVTITMKKRVKVEAIGFKSANDCPHRDPDTVEIKYLAPNYSNAVLANHQLDF
jgi:hypothetical protein